jgi:transcription elongation factor GreA
MATHNHKIQITKEGYDALKTELAQLVEEKRPKLVDRLSNARQEGDLSENSDYQNAKDELEFLDGRIDELKHVTNSAVIISGKGRKNSIAVGTKVTVKANGVKHIYEIVGEWEADPVNKKISHSSPLGQALSGKKIGDKVKVEAPAGKVNYEILKIE